MLTGLHGLFKAAGPALLTKILGNLEIFLKQHAGC